MAKKGCPLTQYSKELDVRWQRRDAHGHKNQKRGRSEMSKKGYPWTQDSEKGKMLNVSVPEEGKCERHGRVAH